VLVLAGLVRLRLRLHLEGGVSRGRISSRGVHLSLSLSRRLVAGGLRVGGLRDLQLVLVHLLALVYNLGVDDVLGL